MGHLVRKIHFGHILRKFSLNSNDYVPQICIKSDSKCLSLVLILAY